MSRKMTAHERALRNLSRRISAAERASGLKIVRPENLKYWTTKNLNALTRRRLLRDYAVQRVKTATGEIELRVSEIKNLTRAMERANRLAEEYTGQPLYSGISSISASSEIGVKHFLAGIKRRGQRSWWDERVRTMTDNFIASTAWIAHMYPADYERIISGIRDIGEQELGHRLHRAVNSERSLAGYFFASDDEEFWGMDAISEIYALLDIEEPDRDEQGG